MGWGCHWRVGPGAGQEAQKRWYRKPMMTMEVSIVQMLERAQDVVLAAASWCGTCSPVLGTQEAGQPTQRHVVNQTQKRVDTSSEYTITKTNKKTE